MTTSNPSLLPLANHCEDNLENIDKFLTAVTKAFYNTAITRAIICEVDNITEPYSKDVITSERRRQHFQGVVDRTKNRYFLEAGDWSAVSLWELPDYSGTPFVDSEPPTTPLRRTWTKTLRQIKIKNLALPGSQHNTSDNDQVYLRPYYHLSFLARDPSKPAVPGAISAVVKPVLERARQEGVPAWLEATTERATQIYTSFGFRIVDAVTFQQGHADIDGWPKEGGEGFKIWFMICDSHLIAN